MKRSKKKVRLSLKLNCKFDNQGFATISLLLFLPVLGLMIFSFGFSGYLIQHKTKIRSICLTEGRKIQENLARNEEGIMKLNPIASDLRLRLNLAYAELAVAAANPALIAEAQAKISLIKNQQKQLDSLQKSLLKKTKIEAVIQSLSMQDKLIQIDQQTNRIWQFYLEIFASSTLAHTPEVALVPDSPDIAPIYELENSYQTKQHLAFQWQTLFRTKASAQKLLESENQVDFLCYVTAKKEGTKWKLLINGDKS